MGAGTGPTAEQIAKDEAAAKEAEAKVEEDRAAAEREAQATDPNPAREQSPVATEAQEAIVGDQGRREQQPMEAGGSQDSPHATSAPPPSAQSGVPLPEDRAAGVKPGPEAHEPTGHEGDAQGAE